MASGSRFERFVPNKPGIAAVAKSPAVQALVRQKAEALCAEANAMAASVRAAVPSGMVKSMMKRDPRAFEEPPYKAVVYAGRFDTIGAVRANTAEGGYDQNLNHTLDLLGH